MGESTITCLLLQKSDEPLYCTFESTESPAAYTLTLTDMMTVWTAQASTDVLIKQADTFLPAVMLDSETEQANLIKSLRECFVLQQSSERYHEPQLSRPTLDVAFPGGGALAVHLSREIDADFTIRWTFHCALADQSMARHHLQENVLRPLVQALAMTSRYGEHIFQQLQEEKRVVSSTHTAAMINDCKKDFDGFSPTTRSIARAGAKVDYKVLAPQAFHGLGGRALARVVAKERHGEDVASSQRSVGASPLSASQPLKMKRMAELPPVLERCASTEDPAKKV